jgi:hypothetical protein
VDTSDGIRSLRAASPYHVVPPSIALPAVLLHSANDDYNFGTEMLVAKYVPRLQAANSGERPVLWVRAAGGHRWLSSLSPEGAATVASFLLWQTGVPGSSRRLHPCGCHERRKSVSLRVTRRPTGPDARFKNANKQWLSPTRSTRADPIRSSSAFYGSS